jgi:hypothetical protein
VLHSILLCSVPIPRWSNSSSRSAGDRATGEAGVYGQAHQQSGGTRAFGQPACDEERIGADERRLHLPE